MFAASVARSGPGPLRKVGDPSGKGGRGTPSLLVARRAGPGRPGAAAPPPDYAAQPVVAAGTAGGAARRAAVLDDRARRAGHRAARRPQPAAVQPHPGPPAADRP